MPKPIKTAKRHRLHEHVLAAALAYVVAALEAAPSEELRERLADWVENLTDYTVITATLDTNARHRPDARSLTFHAMVRLPAGVAGPKWFTLVSVRARDLLMPDGTPVDARADSRTLLLQHGIGVPDDARQLVPGGA